MNLRGWIFGPRLSDEAKAAMRAEWEAKDSAARANKVKKMADSLLAGDPNWSLPVWGCDLRFGLSLTNEAVALAFKELQGRD